MIKKINIIEEKEFDIDVLTDNIDHVIKYLQERKNDGWAEMCVDYEKDYDGDICGKLSFVKMRPETDKEYNKRCKTILKDRKKAQKLKKQKAEAELILYKKLKQKYEKTKV